MESIEERLQTLTSAIQQIQVELYNLRMLVYWQPWSHIKSRNNRYVSGRNCDLESKLNILGLEIDNRVPRNNGDIGHAILNNDNGYEEIFDTETIRRDIEHIPSPLTLRETQILNGVASGNTNKQMALFLRISEQTIKNHVSSILHKLGAKDRAHAVYIAIHRGWLSVEIERVEAVTVS